MINFTKSVPIYLKHLSKHQSASIPDDLKFEKDIAQVEDSSRPNVNISIIYFEDVSR